MITIILASVAGIIAIKEGLNVIEHFLPSRVELPKLRGYGPDQNAVLYWGSRERAGGDSPR